MARGHGKIGWCSDGARATLPRTCLARAWPDRQSSWAEFSRPSPSAPALLSGPSGSETRAGLERVRQAIQMNDLARATM